MYYVAEDRSVVSTYIFRLSCRFCVAVNRQVVITSTEETMLPDLVPSYNIIILLSNCDAYEYKKVIVVLF
jgi:hypothetical protein